MIYRLPRRDRPQLSLVPFTPVPCEEIDALSMVLSQTIDGLRILSLGTGIVPGVGSSLSKAFTLATELAKIFEDAQANKDKIRTLAEEAARLSDMIVLQLQKTQAINPSSLEERMKSVQEIMNVLDEVVLMTKKKKQNLARRAWNRKEEAEAIKKWERKLTIQKDNFMLDSHLSIQNLADQVRETTNTTLAMLQTLYGRNLTQDLKPVYAARHTMDGSDGTKIRKNCLKDTRVGVLHTIKQWAEDKNEKRFFYLSGLAGSGKSTIAQTICDQIWDSKPHHLGATFFFSRDEASRRNPNNVVRTLAYQLSRLPQLGKLVMEALQQNVDVVRSSMREQLLVLIVRPLAQATNLPSPLIIVFDALDECDRYGGELIPLLAHTLGSLPSSVHLKLLITSRPIPEVQSQLDDVPHASLQLHDIDRKVVDDEIRTYLQHHLREIARIHPGMDQRTWPSEADVTALVNRSGGLFIFAATIVTYVKVKISPAERLRTLLAAPVAKSTDERYKQLDDLYLQVLDTAERDGDRDDEWYRYLKRVAGTVALIQNPLPEDAFVQLLNEQLEATRSALHSLSAVVLIPKAPKVEPTAVVRAFHPSFPDFITNSDRCKGRFFVEKPKHFTMLARRCLEVMNQGQNLRTDICRIADPSLLNSEVLDLKVRLQKNVLPEVAFACRFWLDSLLRAIPGDHSILPSLNEFCEKHVMNWIEICSLIGALPYILTGLRHIRPFFQGYDRFDKANSILQNVERILLDFFTPLSESALHVYHSVHPLLPSCSLLDLVGDDLHDFHATPPRLLTPRLPSWAPMLKELEGHSQPIMCMTLSHDSEKLAGGLFDGNLHFWDPWSGRSLGPFTSTRTSESTGVAFSLNDRQIVASQLDSIHIWDAITGTHIRDIQTHQDRIFTLATSPREHRCASGAKDGSIFIWDLRSGQCTRSLSTAGSHGPVWKLLYTADGSQIVSGHYKPPFSAETSVFIWDVTSGAKVGELRADWLRVQDFALASSRRLLVSGNRDGTICIWDIDSRRQVRLLQGHTSSVSRVAVSNPNDIIISGDTQGNLRIWSMDTGVCLNTFRAHQSSITSIIPFADGSRCCTAVMYDVRIWSIEIPITPALQDTEEPATSQTPSVTNRLTALMQNAYNEAKSLLTTAPIDGSPLDTHAIQVNAATLSPDGSTLAIGRKDGSVQLVFVHSTDPPRELVRVRDPADPIASLSFSADGRWLVSTCYALITRIWDVESGREVEKYDNCLLATLFPNQKAIAITISGKPTGVIRIMSTSRRGHQLREFVDPELVTSMQISLNNRFLLSTHHGRCYVWDVIGNARLSSFSCLDNTLLTFTPDSQRVMSYDLTGFTTTWNATDEADEEPPVFEGESAAALFHITPKGWVCGPTSPNGVFKRLVWLPPSRRMTGRCWFHGGVLTTVASSGLVTRLDVSDLLEYHGKSGTDRGD